LPASAGAYPRIYAVVMRIPRGRVATYGQVAAEAGPRVPWHRVVAAGGKVSLGKLDPSGAITQRLRLEHEGVRFDGRGCVDMEKHSWKPRSRNRRAPD
jgi:methylated-DNA-protein-cysteine methyltransferase-like protein